MERRTFAQVASAFLISEAWRSHDAGAQEAGDMNHPVQGEPTNGPGGPRPKEPLPLLASGVFTPGPPSVPMPKRISHRYLLGLLKAGNTQMEIHETRQEVGAVHEPAEKHLHNEIWLVREGVCELTTNGVTRRMEAGDVGLCCAGDMHYIRNAGDTPCTYFVVTVGPPEP